jgi:hypothetical protein
MELTTALENVLEVKYPYAAEEIEVIRTNKEQAIPVLLERVKYVSENADKDGFENDDRDCYAMFLLAEFRVKEAFPYLVRYLDFDDDLDILEDTLTEGFGAILASCAENSDYEALRERILNKNLDEFCRMAAFCAVKILFFEGIVDRETVISLIRELIATYEQGYFGILLLDVVCSSCDMRLSELAEELKTISALPRKNGEERYYETAESMNDIIDNEIFLTEYKSRGTNERLVTDVAELMSWWYCFTEEYAEAQKRKLERLGSTFEPYSLSDKSNGGTFSYANTEFGRKVGRNEPCPCGSGKKYKKCCGAKA